MIAAIIALIVGFFIGVAVACRALIVTSAARPRRTMTQLEDALDGLESAYRIEIATMDARREIAGLPRLQLADELHRIRDRYRENEPQ
jgi:uncharacterized membrane-anchored protein YhcB (DUF1043 family)